MNKHFVFVFLVSLLAISCKRERHPVPEVFVDAYIPLNIPSSLPLMSPGGAIYHEGGYKGLIIYRRMLSNSSDDFAAYDRACPNDWERACGRINISSDMQFGYCGCDTAQYLLYDGSAVGNNQSVPLKFYRVQFLGNTLRVFN